MKLFTRSSNISSGGLSDAKSVDNSSHSSSKDSKYIAAKKTARSAKTSKSNKKISVFSFENEVDVYCCDDDDDEYDGSSITTDSTRSLSNNSEDSTTSLSGRQFVEEIEGDAYSDSVSYGSDSSESGDTPSRDKNNEETRENCEDDTSEQNTNKQFHLPPRPVMKTTQNVFVLRNDAPKTKAQPLREIRRTASKGSKEFVHVFHLPLSTLPEEISSSEVNEESSINDETAAIPTHDPKKSLLGEDEIKRRWMFSLEVQAKRTNVIESRDESRNLQNVDYKHHSEDRQQLEVRDN